MLIYGAGSSSSPSSRIKPACETHMTTTEAKIDCGYCPACYADLKLEEDPRMRTGYARVCDNPDCRDGGGAWPAQEWLVRQWQAANLGTEGAV